MNTLEVFEVLASGLQDEQNNIETLLNSHSAPDVIDASLQGMQQLFDALTLRSVGAASELRRAGDERWTDVIAKKIQLSQRVKTLSERAREYLNSEMATKTSLTLVNEKQANDSDSTTPWLRRSPDRQSIGLTQPNQQQNEVGRRNTPLAGSAAGCDDNSSVHSDYVTVDETGPTSKAGFLSRSNCEGLMPNSTLYAAASNRPCREERNSIPYGATSFRPYRDEDFDPQMTSYASNFANRGQHGNRLDLKQTGCYTPVARCPSWREPNRHAMPNTNDSVVRKTERCSTSA